MIYKIAYKTEFLFALTIFVLLYSSSSGQTFLLKGTTVDSFTGEGLASATIAVYKEGKITGSVSNKTGQFAIYTAGEPDSIKCSMIGYRSKIIAGTKINYTDPLIIQLERQSVELAEVVVLPMTAMDIVEKVIQRLPSSQVAGNFETSGFYREIIKDGDNYFSVAEALFIVQFFPGKKDFKLKLDKGRVKEDIAYTALFEDYHPGGGPQRAVENSFLTGIPSFLKKKELKKFHFKKDTSSYYDGKRLYVIAFDQKPGVKEALEKGKLFIDAEDFSIIKYEAETSQEGIPYIKHLTGTDKMFAGLLGIDLKRKGWKRTVEFVKANDKWVLNHADMEFQILYKQPKKNIDLDLTLSLELLLNPEQNSITKEISKEKEWKKKHLVKNLPFVFDSAYWGAAATIIPTQKIKDVINSITLKNNTSEVFNSAAGWSKYNESAFVAYQREDSVILIPITKSNWEDDKTGPLLYREMEKDFSIEVKINIAKNTDKLSAPDNGFQQCGIMIRSASNQKENHVSLTIGTSGNKHKKLMLTKTTNGKSKSIKNDMPENTCWLKLEKKGTVIRAYKKIKESDKWELIKAYENDEATFVYQVGLTGFAHFPGNGPKMHPDSRGVFTNIKITEL